MKRSILNDNSRTYSANAESFKYSKKRLFPDLLLVAIALIVVAGACRRQPAAVEVKGPILGVMTSTGFDDKGRPQNRGVTFASTEPQVAVIVQMGKLDSDEETGASGATSIRFGTVAEAAAEPMLNIVWHHVSDEGEQKLFAHQVKVRSFERAYSIGKSKGALKTGTYKVTASLAGQTQETVLHVRPAKAEPSSGDASQASVNPASTTRTVNEEGSGETPADGGSGTFSDAAAHFPEHETHLEIKTMDDDEPTKELDQHAVDYVVLACCGDLEGEVTATVNGPAEVIDHFVASAKGDRRVFKIDPCFLPGGSNLPGTKVTLEAAITQGTHKGLRFSKVLTLSEDISPAFPKVQSSPRHGTRVRAGDKIVVTAKASEVKTEGYGSWETGVQRVQLIGPDGLVDQWTNPSRLPQPCHKKTWEHQLKATYIVPPNPPPIIRLCVMTEDYAGNEWFECAEFPTGNVWKGTMRSQTSLSFSYQCSAEYETTLKLVVGGDGAISGKGYAKVTKPTTCNTPRECCPLQSATFRVEGTAYDDRLELRLYWEASSPSAYDHGGFAVVNFVQGVPPLVIPITLPGVAEGQSNVSRWGATSVNNIRLRCETCTPRVALTRERIGRNSTLN